MTERYDRLSSGLADRLAASPTRGRAVVEEWHRRTAPYPPERRSATLGLVTEASWASVTTSPVDTPEDIVPDGRPREVRRAHLVPTRLHARARRRKVELANGHRLTWNDVLVDGVDRLLRCDDPLPVLEAALVEGQPNRLVQAMLPISLDRRLAALHIDLNESSERRVTLEMLWSGAIMLWAVADDPLL